MPKASFNFLSTTMHIYAIEADLDFDSGHNAQSKMCSVPVSFSTCRPRVGSGWVGRQCRSCIRIYVFKIWRWSRAEVLIPCVRSTRPGMLGTYRDYLRNLKEYRRTNVCPYFALDSLYHIWTTKRLFKRERSWQQPEQIPKNGVDISFVYLLDGIFLQKKCL